MAPSMSCGARRRDGPPPTTFARLRLAAPCAFLLQGPQRSDHGTAALRTRSTCRTVCRPTEPTPHGVLGSVRVKLYGLSDLHVGFEANRRTLSELPPHPDDWLVLGGDIGES